MCKISTNQIPFPPCTTSKISGPVLVLQCPELPSLTALTIGGLPVVFVPDVRMMIMLAASPEINTRIQGREYHLNGNSYPTFAPVESSFLQVRDLFPNIAKVDTYWIRATSFKLRPYREHCLLVSFIDFCCMTIGSLDKQDFTTNPSKRLGSFCVKSNSQKVVSRIDIANVPSIDQIP